MDPKITGFEMFGLPTTFASRIYSRAALGELQAVIRDRLRTPEAVRNGSDTAFVDGAVRLIGETMIRHIGGHWHFTVEAGVPWRGRPVLVLDVPGSSEADPIDVLKLVVNTVKLPQHDVLLDAFDLNLAAAPVLAAAPTPEPGSRLERWLNTMESELAAWRNGPGAPADRWDYSLESLDTLGEWILDRYPEGTDWLKGEITAEQEREFTGAARYFGQTLLTHYPGHWRYSEGERVPRNPFTGYAVVTRKHPETRDPISVTPEVSIRVLLKTREPGRLRKKARQYAPK